MSDTAFVVLPAGTKIRFPDVCVACGSPRPGRKEWLLAVDPVSKRSMFSWLLTPMCGSCLLKQRLRRWTRVAGWILLFLGIVVSPEFIPAEWRNDQVEKGVIGVLAFAALMIMIAWDWIFPAAFTFSGDKTFFSFESPAVATAFKQFNQAAELGGINFEPGDQTFFSCQPPTVATTMKPFSQPAELAAGGCERGDKSVPWPAWENYQGGLGASIWEYCVPYQPDIQKALSELRDRELEAGRFYMSELRPQSFDEAIRNANAPGTRSILDISRISMTRGIDVISPAPGDAIRRLFGTDRPTKAMVEHASREWTDEFGEFLETYDRGEGVYWILYENDEPSEIYFAGWSYD